MSKELFKKILVDLKEENYSGRISFSFYNEPLLVNELEYFASQLKYYLPKTFLLIYTNGSLLTIPKINSLISSGVDYFVVTKHEDEYQKTFSFDEIYRELSEEVKLKYFKYQLYTDLKITNRGGLVEGFDKPIDASALPCSIPMNMLTITNKGTVVPCFEDYHQVHAVGNIMDKSLKELWNSKEYVIFRKKLLLGLRKDYAVCSKCNRTEMLEVE